MKQKRNNARNHLAAGSSPSSSVVFLVHGNGKGKTTSAFGQALRVWGGGGKVAFYQFIKSSRWRTGEAQAVAALKSSRFRLVVGGKGFVGILGDTLPREAHARAAHRTLERAAAAARSGRWDLVVLDEVLVAGSLGLIDPAAVVRCVRERSSHTDVYLTGRASKEILRALLPLADVVTECREVRHIFASGTQGKRGREY
ncbi:cob(I)yrinic acid a,c-diamide adenosyltransferase [Candidatus Parcubacteria bacterium]|nr:MAG: cob(I)yrinic acid a,c-diamide adenosyltransferase [Candidatus Parcubacteria bacterium]GIW69061.1 MAG: cob(I)yrinic acid a,c-diamide adenosyltransferase [Candidatus Parcubacteria bacterium]